MSVLRRLAVAVILAGAACLPADARPKPQPPLADASVAALGERLEAAVEERLQIVPEADEALAALAVPCATSLAPVRPRVFRDARPRVLGLPGGRVLVSTGLIAVATCDDDIAGVLAHEAAHVRAADVVRQLETAYGTPMLELAATGKAEDVLSGIAANLAAGGVFARHSVTADQRAEDAARAAGCGTGAVARLVTRGHVQGRGRRRSREHPAMPLAGDAPPSPSLAGLERLRTAVGPTP